MEIDYGQSTQPYNGRITLNLILNSNRVNRLTNMPIEKREQILGAVAEAQAIIYSISMGRVLAERAYYDIIAQALDMCAPQFSPKFKKAAGLVKQLN